MGAARIGEIGRSTSVRMRFSASVIVMTWRPGCATMRR